MEKARGSGRGELFLIILLLIVQIFFWYGVPSDSENENDRTFWAGTRAIKPDLHIVPPVPSEKLVRALALGDEQLYFRVAAFRLQNAGDTFGRVTALKDYDYSMLGAWWSILDDLDPVSDYLPSMVAYYFGATQNPKEQLPYVVDYLAQHADRDPESKWWWYHQAIYLANARMEDTDRALEIAYKLASLPDSTNVPIWTRQMPAFLLEKQGDYAQACTIILNILENKDDLEENEIRFMYYFITERIAAIANAKDQEELVELDPRCLAMAEKYQENNP